MAQVLTNQKDANLALGLGFWKLPWARSLTLELLDCKAYRGDPKRAPGGIKGKPLWDSFRVSQRSSYLPPDTEILTKGTVGPVWNNWSSAMHMNIIYLLPWSISSVSAQSHICFIFLSHSSPGQCWINHK